MKCRSSIIIAVMGVIGFSSSGWAVDNPSVGRGTVPLSTMRSGLIRNRNPIDRSGNLIMTGNVNGGRQFQGTVPYQSPTSFQRVTSSSSSDTTTLDSFLRRSGGSGGIGGYVGRTSTYYPVSSTVTRITPGRRRVLATPTSRVDYRVEDKPLLPTLPKPEKFPKEQEVLGPEVGYKPVVPSSQQMDKVTFSDVDKYFINKRLQLGLREQKQKQLREDLKRTEVDKADTQEVEIKKYVPLKSQLEIERAQTRELSRPFERQISKDATEEAVEPDVYEQMKLQLQEFEETTKELSATKEAEKPASSQAKEGLTAETFRTEWPGKDDSSVKSTKGDKGRLDTDTVSTGDRSTKARDVFLKSLRTDYLEGMNVSSRAKSILGEHKTYASYSKSKFNQYLREAEGYLKRGKYYLAASSYDLAALYKPRDPLVYAGKSHALFAAGEYASSALYLSRVLEVFPEYARFRIDLETMIGNKDQLESRIKDVEQWVGRSNAGDLHFLLGYVYFQVDRLERANESIAKAYEKLPDSPAVAALKAVIDEATGSDK